MRLYLNKSIYNREIFYCSLSLVSLYKPASYANRTIGSSHKGSDKLLVFVYLAVHGFTRVLIVYVA